MTISTFERSATIAEMAVEIDRRGAVIERLEAERDALKAALADAPRPKGPFPIDVERYHDWYFKVRPAALNAALSVQPEETNP